MLKLWYHECNRVFRDRTISNEDAQLFDRLISSVYEKEFEWRLQDTNIIWASFIPAVNSVTKRSMMDIYSEVEDINQLTAKCNDYLEDYNQFYSQNKMSLVLFVNAIEHITRIVRIIQTQFGHGLLVGIGGSGRTSLSKLSTFIALSNEPIQLDQRNWTEELQKLLRIVGVDQK